MRPVGSEVRLVDNKLTSNKWSMHKAYHSPLPLERGWGVRPVGAGGEAGSG